VAIAPATDTNAEIAPDRDEILRVVQLYIDGFNDRDIGKFRQAFHADAWIFFTDADGVLHKALIADCFEQWVSAETKVSSRIISIRQAGDVANVQLSFDDALDPSSSWVDFHSLLRLDGIWKITNKTATHSSRAAWARNPDAAHSSPVGAEAIVPD
jgi:hypothetical protein